MTKKTKRIRNKRTDAVETTAQTMIAKPGGCLLTVVPLLVYEDEIGPIMLYPTVRELLEEADIVYPSEALTDAMEVGKLYSWGISNLYEDFDALCWIVKVCVDNDKLFTTDDEPDNEHTACLVIPADKLLDWAGTEPKESF